MTETGEKQTGYRDSGWYTNFVAFLREFRRHKIGIVGIVILLAYTGMALAAPYLVEHDPNPANKVAPAFLAPGWMSAFDPNGVVTREYMPNEMLETYPPVVQAGVSNSQYSYVQSAGGGSPLDSHTNLTWTYLAGQGGNFVNDPEDDGTDYADMIYFTQQLDWNYERLPSDVNVTVDFAVSLTGDFASHVEGGLMFKLYIWLIDSSGNWRGIYKSFPPYADPYIDRRIDLSYYDIIEGWRGMVLNEELWQEDPEDVLTVAVGLAPTAVFGNFLGTTPWTEWSGSVTVSVRRLSLVAHGEYFGLLGTTDKGADAWSQLVYGSRVSLTIGILATALSTVVGVAVGMAAGYFGGKTDEVLMRVVDFLLVIPGLPLMMVMAAFLGPKVENIIIVIAILGWTGTSRLIRSQVMAEKNKAYVESARAIGASDTYIMLRHILPNVTPILFADITLGVVGAILSESGLAFLGLTDASQPSWGRMLADAQGSGGFSNGAWWVVVFPGMMITIISLAFTFVGHSLDQVLNPRLRQR
ncbi:MAG: ABC transporter permease [Candidatus Thorarchaeota archaeon]